MGYTIGLDLGVASLGWAVVNDEYEVLESCSNIFPAAESANNVERRGFRQGRRLSRRRRTRISDFRKLWEKSGFEVPSNELNEVLQYRIKGMNDKLSEDELYHVLLNSLKHRGISYLDDADDENASGDYAASIAYNENQLKTKLPCEIQWERYKKYGAYRGNITIQEGGEPLTLRNVFTTSAYEKEIQKLLDVQSMSNEKVTKKFIDEYLKIFSRKREYYIGPGNKKSRTDYGVYTTQKNEDGTYHTEQNLFDKLIGKCSVYPDERRAAGATYTAQEFNLLNDLNNLVIDGRKLDEQEKCQIVDAVKHAKTVNMKNIIAKVIGTKANSMNMTGARIDKNEKEIFHSFEAYNKLRKALEEIDFDIETLSTDELDAIGEVLTLNTDRKSIQNGLQEKRIVVPDEVRDVLIATRKRNGSLFSKWQSFGIRIMKELIPELYAQPKNQMQLLTDMGVFKTKDERFVEYDKIPSDLITEEIYNPVVAKTVRITVRVLNALIKKYGYPDRVVIEMPRDKNSEEEKKRIADFQKNNENELGGIIKKVKSEYGIEITDADFKNHSKLGLKLRLWNEQNETCPYSGKHIKIDDLLNNPNMFEVDHIIPLSISFDDSRANKVLVYAAENQNKGNRTPMAYLSNVNREWDFHEYMSFVLSNYKGTIYGKKRDNLLFSEDIYKIDVLQGFISRNINDTRYASKVILNSLQSFFGSKECDTKVKVVRGTFTHQMRMNLKIEKNREESYVHHAVDAMLIAFSQMGYDAYHKLTEKYIDYEHGEFVDQKGYEKLIENDVAYRETTYQNKWMTIKKNIEIAAEKNKYWYQVNRKSNRGLCNQTIYGTRNLDGKTVKISKLDIRTDDGIKKFKGIVEKGKLERFLMYRNDPKTFEWLLQIYKDYSDSKNPFVQYESETGDVIKKVSKTNNGPKVCELRYEDGEVGSCIDISHKYGYKKGSKKVILDSLNPYRMDVYYNTKDNRYYFVGVKYSDIKCQGDSYVIDEDKYAAALVQEKIVPEGKGRSDLTELGYEFKLSFYKNEIIEYEKDGEIYVERFLSRTMPKVSNYIETKPLEAAKFEKRNLVGLAKTSRIRKIRVDILGNRYLNSMENFDFVVGHK
ncbi:type II CRISPR RNA-guided endonuclease Cas9 [Butyrivibrio sp. AC2005]|uniref:type II CRISPR RNA-guided endonuclease Cas9 n=1 Tax=Butyrivibrio sp. AC2005 TaxID=1280672 RepID=UPI0004290F60|nr:type II CRISPR RNA-guided endonuclease Cas9 [Butyrivibrio sp. AC2005]